MRGINVRDYVEIGAVEVNRMGKRQYYLALLSWSTIDRTAPERESIQASLGRVTLWADDRPIELTRLTTDRATVGLSQPPYPPPTPEASESWYASTLGEIAALAGARTLQLAASAPDATEGRRYHEWQTGSSGFAAFIEHIRQPH